MNLVGTNYVYIRRFRGSGFGPIFNVRKIFKKDNFKTNIGPFCQQVRQNVGSGSGMQGQDVQLYMSK
jgi:hypothetical protein